MILRRVLAIGLIFYFGLFAWSHATHENATWALVLMLMIFLVPLNRLNFDQVIKAVKAWKGNSDAD